MVLSADDRFPLSFYYRIADQMMKQAKVYRSEGNAGDLYLALKRYARKVRLVSEVIPKHRSFSKYSSKQKLHHEKILNECVKEIARLKPLFGQTPRKGEQQEEGFHSVSQILNEKGQASVNYTKDKVNCGSTVRKESCKYLIPRTEGCNTKSCTTKENDKLLSGAMVGGRTIYTPSQTRFPVSLTETRDRNITVKVVTHFFPPDLSFTESLPFVGNVSHVTVPESGNEYVESSSGNVSALNAIQDVHISARLMEEFMELARANTDKSIETCGILGAFLKDRTFYVTTLIIPKQESSSNSCQALNEEDIYKIQDEQSLFPVGWIHTHPSQTCFLSSIDLHTQYSYQVMLPEAVAIVMAPTDPTRSYGLFRLTDPGGMAVLRQCQEKGFHQHPETADGSPIYESCSNVYVNPNLRFEIIDLRYNSR